MNAVLVEFAVRFGVSPADAYVLPALFERTAPKVNMSAKQLAMEATYNNDPLGEYLANCAKRIADADRKENAQ